MKKNHNRIGLGTFPLGSVYNPITPEKARNVVETFLFHGGYYIDTAPMYQCGAVESLLGEVLKNKQRDSFFIISKCGKSIYADNTWKQKATYVDVIKQCEDSLKRLRLDYLDLYLIHEPDPITPYEETVKALLNLKEMGKVKEIGLSNVTLGELKEYRKYYPFQVIQNRFSFINRSISNDFLEYLTINKIEYIPYQILEIAQLTGSIIEETNLGSGDLRGTLNYFQNKQLAFVKTWVKDSILPIAKSQNCTIGQLMMAWTLLQPQIPYVFVGTTNPKYVEINLKSDTIVLSQKTQSELNIAYRSLLSSVEIQFKMQLKDFRGLNDRYY